MDEIHLTPRLTENTIAALALASLEGFEVAVNADEERV
jgi:hypothetical protein